MTHPRTSPALPEAHQNALQRRGGFTVIRGGRLRKSSAGVALDCLRDELDAIQVIVAKLRGGETLSSDEATRLRVSALRIRDVRGVLRV